MTSRITLALTGASGMPYALRLLEVLAQEKIGINLLYSAPAQIVLRQEMGITWPSRPADVEDTLSEALDLPSGQLLVYGRDEWFAPIASGSNPASAMVICPCTMGTLAAVATGTSRNLIERAADVSIKEQRKLILVPRETPFSAIHLEHMLTLSRLGVVILAANPAFYHRPQTIDDLVDFIVARILDHLGIPHELCLRWGEDDDEDEETC